MKLNSFLKKYRLIILLMAILVIVGGYFYLIRTKEPIYDFIDAKKADLISEVSVTGSVKPAESADLAFEKTGRIEKIDAKIGKEVIQGEVLVSLEKSELVAQLAQANANVKVQNAKLEELLSGSRPEEIRVEEVKVENAKISLNDVRINLIDKINDAYTKSDDAIRNKADQIFINPRSSNPQLSFIGVDSKLDFDIKYQRLAVEENFNLWKSSLEALKITSDLDFYSTEAKNNLSQIADLLNKAALAVNSAATSASLSQTTINSWKSDISTARTNVNTAIANLSSAGEELRASKSNLALAQEQLALKKTGATVEQIAAAQAQLEEAKANVLNTNAQIFKTRLMSPIDGIVTKINAEIGEIVSSNLTVISVISKSHFKIEANVAEADIAKLKIGDLAKVTLDAYGNDVIFEAKVAFIDPTETVIEGVPTYKTTLQFINNDNRIKSGMTANLDIITDKRDNVIVIPQRAIISEGLIKKVKVIKENTVTERNVVVGLLGSDGNIEIIKGLSEGDRIITGEK
ncbi:MAG: efflux RND transporter periplasmic adaptor subunit [Patescibacteria group bacterium]